MSVLPTVQRHDTGWVPPCRWPVSSPHDIVVQVDGSPETSCRHCTMPVKPPRLSASAEAATEALVRTLGAQLVHPDTGPDVGATAAVAVCVLHATHGTPAGHHERYSAIVSVMMRATYCRAGWSKSRSATLHMFSCAHSQGTSDWRGGVVTVTSRVGTESRGATA